jgi:hypothetical protein
LLLFYHSLPHHEYYIHYQSSNESENTEKKIKKPVYDILCVCLFQTNLMVLVVAADIEGQGQVNDDDSNAVHETKKGSEQVN